jgi:hypothetical protein
MIPYLTAKLGARKREVGVCPPGVKNRKKLVGAIDSEKYSMLLGRTLRQNVSIGIEEQELILR